MSLVLDLSDEQRMILETLERAAVGANAFDARLRRLRAETPDRMALWAEISALGALGLCLPEEMGGIGGTPRDMALLPAALGAALAVEPFLAAGVTAACLLRDTDAVTEAEALVAGKVLIPALSEGADPFAPPATRAHKGDGWMLSGAKPALRHGDVAEAFLVTARMPDGAVGLFLCAAGAPGLERSALRLVDDAGAADVTFSDTPALLLSADAQAIVDKALDWTVAALCVETAAICAAVAPLTFAYMAERKQFGAPLSRFQALQFKAADMQVAATEAAAAADAALIALSMDDAIARRSGVLRASLTADRCGRACTHAAVQMHGGMGVSDELVISHYARRAAAIRSQIGTEQARATWLDEMTAATAA
ncbi:MAG: acyl-CoA dehydrogenase family protein [Sagittula sp.]|uniref:acyl-CoA dehydrogenase family protein n=1 Tax=Sagittula sp. TaxID=2038081 RepID=UPI00405962F4